MAKVGTLGRAAGAAPGAGAQGEGDAARRQAAAARGAAGQREAPGCGSSGTCAMALMRDKRVRDSVAKELAKEGVLRKDGDAELFADLLAGELRADGGGERGAPGDGRAGEPGRRRCRPGRGGIATASAAGPRACRLPSGRNARTTADVSPGRAFFFSAATWSRVR